jgi:hypothetical protein
MQDQYIPLTTTIKVRGNPWCLAGLVALFLVCRMIQLHVFVPVIDPAGRLPINKSYMDAYFFEISAVMVIDHKDERCKLDSKIDVVLYATSPGILCLPLRVNKSTIYISVLIFSLIN